MQPPKILIVDDEADILRMLVLILAPHGHEVHKAESAEAAMAHASGGGSIDLLITDYRLGEANGVELFRSLKESRPSLKAIGISGNPEAEVLFNRLGQGFVLKPFSVSTFLAAVRQALSSTQPVAGPIERRRHYRLEMSVYPGRSVLIQTEQQQIVANLINISSSGALAGVDPAVAAEFRSGISAALVFNSVERPLQLTAKATRITESAVAFAFDETCDSNCLEPSLK